MCFACVSELALYVVDLGFDLGFCVFPLCCSEFGCQLIA